jgi:Ca2+-binding EF-hand superfamily protein
MRRIHARNIILTVLALIVLAAPIFAQSPAQPDWKERFRAHDKNGDGRIDREEFQQWMVEVFYFRDKDRKGYLVLADFQGTIGLETLKVINRKGDGKLTLTEFLNAAFLDFQAIDADKNGYITIEEVERYIRVQKQ